ncbi:energy transducer TonB [Microbulbifer sp. CAU 1566]|uniref:energy transducer TonB n=1 Tax=Microbulbifer sp. CAU 1566 TaxID=2933269 RepID=UPI00200679B7|nr:energy transducer TonB [Microbulbifer sp. CAU 1566]MCK7596292.1 energy transducer TonB [Microbulbifer sp. CAU 1566]
MTVMLICSFALHGWLLWAKPATEVPAPSAAVALKLGQLKLAPGAEQSQPQTQPQPPEKAPSKKAQVTDAPDLKPESNPTPVAEVSEEAGERQEKRERQEAQETADMTPVASVSQAPTQAVERMQQQSLSDIPVLVERPAFASPPDAPVYPELARQRRQQGTVVVEVQLDASGTQVVRRLLQSSGVDSLDEAALRAVARWHFLPYRENGRARLSRVQLPIRFSL